MILGLFTWLFGAGGIQTIGRHVALALDAYARQARTTVSMLSLWLTAIYCRNYAFT